MKYLLTLLGIMSVFTSLFAEEFIRVYKTGTEFFVRSSYSAKEDLIIHNWRYANEKAYLVTKDTPTEKYYKGKVLHVSADDYPATVSLGSFGTLSGNHGSYFASLLTAPNHGLTVKDTGGIVTCSKGVTYVIMGIVDKDTLIIHPEGTPRTAGHTFTFHAGNPLTYKGAPLAFTNSRRSQLYPLNRITRFELLADGKTPVPEKKEIKCRFADFIFVHDVLNPAEAVKAVKNAPGKAQTPAWSVTHAMCFYNTPEEIKKYPEYGKLPALATYSNTFRYQPRGANVNYRKVHYHTALKNATDLHVMFAWNGEIARQKKQLFYIPKLKPLKVKNGKGPKAPEITIDLTSGYELPKQLGVSYYIPVKDTLDPGDLPDRFIRVAGDEQGYRYGIALGYSLFMGSSAKGYTPRERDIVYHIYKSHKMYPIANTPKNIKPGQVIETVAYRQYFDPQIEPDATSFYCHYQGTSLVVHLDFHKVVKNKTVKLPAAAAGKKITILEKTAALELHTKGVVPAEGIKLSNNAKHGYLVLKLD